MDPPSMLDRLPDEMKMAIARQISSSTVEVFLNFPNQVAYEVYTPEWKGLYSLQRSNLGLLGPTTDAIARARANCRKLAINFFRRDEVEVTRHIVPSIEIAGFQELEITIPLKLSIDEYVEVEDEEEEEMEEAEAGHFTGATHEALIALTLKFTRGANNRWICPESDRHELLLSSSFFQHHSYHPDETLYYFQTHPIKILVREIILLVLNGHGPAPPPLSRVRLFRVFARIRAAFMYFEERRVYESRLIPQVRAFRCEKPTDIHGNLVIELPQQEFQRTGAGWTRIGSRLFRDDGSQESGSIREDSDEDEEMTIGEYMESM